METRRNAFGRGCFLVGLAVLYGLLGLKVYVAWRDGSWPAWPVGENLPDVLVRGIFSLEPPFVRSALAWLLSRDVLEVAAAVCLLVGLLSLGCGDGERSDDRPGDVSR